MFLDGTEWALRGSPKSHQMNGLVNWRFGCNTNGCSRNTLCLELDDIESGQ